MTNENHKENNALVGKVFVALLGSPWIEVSAELWKLGRKVWRGLSAEGMYEALKYNITYEIKDNKGKEAHFHKQEEVRYLQDNIFCYLDPAWGEGKFLQNYQCSPGVKVDEYKLGHKTISVISLRGMRQRGQEEEINVRWDSYNSFLNSSEYCEAEIYHRTKQFSMQVIFPKDRPPLKASIFENTRRERRPLKDGEIRKLPDGKWRIRWETDKPRLYERYILSWDW